MLFSVSTLFYILAPALLVQYSLTLFCLVKLVFLELPKKRFWVWNFFILLIPVIGIGTFLICYFCFKSKAFSKAGTLFANIAPAPASGGEPVTHIMHLESEPFEMIKNETKTVEIRLYDEKRRKLKAGDIIEFIKQSGETERLSARVLNIKVYASFEELYKNTPFAAFGRADKTLKQLLDSTYIYYSKEDEKRFGAAAIELTRIEQRNYF